MRPAKLGRDQRRSANCIGERNAFRPRCVRTPAAQAINERNKQNKAFLEAQKNLGDTIDAVEAALSALTSSDKSALHGKWAELAHASRTYLSKCRWLG